MHKIKKRKPISHSESGFPFDIFFEFLVERADYIAVAPAFLCLIKNLIRLREQILHILRISKTTDPDTAADVPELRQNTGDILPKRFDFLPEPFLCHRFFYHHRKLVAADSADCAAGRKNPLQRIRNLPQHPVARRMTACIVNRFEIVHIQKQKPTVSLLLLPLLCALAVIDSRLPITPVSASKSRRYL